MRESSVSVVEMTLPQTIAQILDNWGMRYQDPSITQTRGKHPKWIIRPVVPILTATGYERCHKTITLGRVADMTPKQAAREKQRVMAEINGGGSVITAQVKLSELVTRYREARLPMLASSTQAKHSAHLRNHIAELETLTLMELSPALVQSWLMKKDIAPATRADLRNLLSALFEQARRWRMWEGENPITLVDIGRMSAVRDKRIPTEAEVRRLREALDCCGSVTRGVRGPDVRLMLDVVIATGWRISEVLGLKQDAIHGETLEVRRRWHRGDWSETLKTAAGRRRNWVGLLADELRGRGDVVFAAADGNPPDDRDLNQHILRPCAVAIDCYWQGFGFHSFRRLNVSWRAEAGAHPFEIAAAAGHSRVDMSLHYAVAGKDREVDVGEKIRRRVQ